MAVSAGDADRSPNPAEQGDGRPTRYRWLIVGQLWLHQVLALCAVSGLGVLLLSMQSDLSFGTIEAGWLGSARTIGPFIVLPLSFMVVGFAPKRLYMLLLLGMGTALVLSGIAPTFWLLLISQIAFSLSLALSQVPAAVLRTQWVRRGEMARVWGIGNALSAISQSLTLALVPLALVLLGGWRPVFLVGGLLLVLAAVAWQIVGRERTAVVTDVKRSRGVRVLRRKEFYFLGLATLGGGTAYTTAILFLPLYLVDERGFSLTAAGAITAALPAAGLLSNLSAGFLSDRSGRRKLFIWPMGIALPALYVLVMSPIPPTALLVAVFAVGYCAWFPFPVLMAIPYELPGIQPSDVAVGQSLVQAVAGIGFISGPIVASQVAAATGSYREGLLALGLLPVLFAVACIWLPETGQVRMALTPATSDAIR